MQRIELPNDSASVRAARDFVRSTLTVQGLDGDLAALVVSELASNVIRHARTPFSVLVELRSGRVRIEVENGAGAQAVAIQLGQAVGGMGLQIVESLSADWGFEVRGDRKAVWVELPA